MPVIPKLNLRKEQIDITSLNRWADAVQMALSELDGHSRVAVRNASESITTSNAVGNAQVLSFNPISNLVVSAPVKTLSAANPGNPTQDNLPDGSTHVRLLATHAASNVAYNFKGAWSSVTSYVIGDEVTSNNIYWIALVNNTNSQPTSVNTNWQAVGRIVGDVQIFTSSGTWSKPAAGNQTLITVIGAGGGGSNGTAGSSGSSGQGGAGGGPGGFSQQTIPTSVLGATESVTVGLGGGAGIGGGTSSFGNWLQATGGSPGVGVTPGASGIGNIASGGLSLFPGSGGAGGSGGTTNANGITGGNGANGASARTIAFNGGSGGTGGTSGSETGSIGGTGTSASTDEPAGGGGGGGGGGGFGGSLGIGGPGGPAGNYGAGGGGGGGGGRSAATPAGGTGGSGAPGLIVIATF